MPEILTQAQIDEYNEVGAIVVHNVLSSQEVQRLRRVTDEMVEKSRAISTHTDIYDLEDTHSAAQPRVRRIKQPHIVDPAYGDLVRHPRILAALRDLVAACKELGLQAGFQNHSGHNYVGAPIWDVFNLIGELDPAHCGMCFDIGHATIEGGLSWPTQAKLIAPFYTAVYIKDFSWQKTAKGWTAAWCPLGEGMIHRSFITTLKNSTYTGPISQHHEYELGDAPTMSAYFKKDLAVLKTWLA
jgi:sugar phosphate isomerase/epimerase